MKPEEIRLDDENNEVSPEDSDVVSPEMLARIKAEACCVESLSPNQKGIREELERQGHKVKPE